MTTILVIEDENDILEEIADVLRFEGFNVTACSNGPDGVSSALEIEPDLIISDIMMPRMDGMEVLQELRKSAPTRTTPFIFLTARGERTMMRQGMELGADDYIIKPITHAELLAAVYARLKRHEEFHKMLDGLTAAKRQFVRMITHELRTPLTPINLVHDILNVYLREYSEDEIKDMVDSLSYGTRRLNRIVEQVICMVELDTGLIVTGASEEPGAASYLYKQDAATILASAINLGRQLAFRNHNLDIESDDHDTDLMQIMIEGNMDRLIYALGELIANAIAFSEKGGTVHVRFRSNADTAYVYIIDHGRGMTSEQIIRAVKPFEQINRDKKEQQGIGLGLTIATRIIELHQGVINIHSEVNKGTKIAVKLPLIQRAH